MSFEFERTGFLGAHFEVQASPKPGGVYSAETMAGTRGKTRDSAVRRGAVEEGRDHDSPNTPLFRSPPSDLFFLPLLLLLSLLLKRTYTRSFHRGESMVSEKSDAAK